MEDGAEQAALLVVQVGMEMREAHAAQPVARVAVGMMAVQVAAMAVTAALAALLAVMARMGVMADLRRVELAHKVQRSL